MMILLVPEYVTKTLHLFVFEHAHTVSSKHASDSQDEAISHRIASEVGGLETVLPFQTSPISADAVVGAMLVYRARPQRGGEQLKPEQRCARM